MTTTVFNSETKSADNKIPGHSGLYDAKMSEIERKYFTNSSYNKFASDILHAKIKQKELVNKSNICNLVKNSDLNTTLATLPTKEELKVEQDKIAKLQAFDSSHFHGKNFFGNDGFQDMFVYQPILNTLKLKWNTLTGNLKIYLNGNFFHQMVVSCVT